MGSSIIILAGIATFFNVAMIMHKFQKGDNANALIDFGVLAGVMYIFKGSFSALAVGVIASALFSVYLLFKPLDTTKFEDW